MLMEPYMLEIDNMVEKKKMYPEKNFTVLVQKESSGNYLS